MADRAGCAMFLVFLECQCVDETVLLRVMGQRWALNHTWLWANVENNVHYASYRSCVGPEILWEVRCEFNLLHVSGERRALPFSLTNPCHTNGIQVSEKHALYAYEGL